MISWHIELEIFRDGLRQYGLRKAVATLWHNIRFEVGYWIGGFTHAERH